MNKIIKGDQVVVVAGKDSGKQGRVIRVLGNKVVVEILILLSGIKSLILCAILRAALLLKRCQLRFQMSPF